MKMEIRAKVDELFDHEFDAERIKQHNKDLDALRKKLNDATAKLGE